eukprot:c8830_g1_i2.p1 GENE.c8830_g1_i2~~c8830_g1_i2.p1  ORF type:complete len:184 (+),score=33.05 c8830_g1_i2:60-611(+)
MSSFINAPPSDDSETKRTPKKKTAGRSSTSEPSSDPDLPPVGSEPWNVVIGHHFVGAVAFPEFGFAHFEIVKKAGEEQERVLTCLLWQSADTTTPYKPRDEESSNAPLIQVRIPRTYDRAAGPLRVKIPTSNTVEIPNAGRIGHYAVPAQCKPGDMFVVDPSDEKAFLWETMKAEQQIVPMLS